MKARMRCFRVISKGSHRLAHQVQSFSLAIESLDGFSLHLLEQVFFTGSDVVDELLRQRLLFGERFGLAYRGFGDLNVPAALGNHRTHQRGGIVLNFFFHYVVHLAAADGDRMSCARVGPRSHGRHVGAFQNEESSRCGPASPGVT